MEDGNERLSGIKPGDWLRIGGHDPSPRDRFSRVTKVTKTMVIVSAHERFRHNGKPVGGTYTSRWAYPTTVEQVEAWQKAKLEQQQKIAADGADRKRKESEDAFQAAKFLDSITHTAARPEDWLERFGKWPVINAAEALGWARDQ